MKIYDKPTKEHYTNKDDQEHNISKVTNGYTIRHTQTGILYYYGCYKTLEEAIQVNKQLATKKYPREYSTQHLKLRGKQYKQKLKKLLEEKEK